MQEMNETFELCYYEENAIFKKPEFSDIEQYFNDMFISKSNIIACSMLLERLYVEGDKTFITDEDYLIDMQEEFADMIQSLLGNYEKNIIDDKIEIVFENEVYLFKKPTFKTNRRLMTESKSLNFNYINFLKTVVYDTIISDNILDLTNDKCKLIKACIILASMIDLTKIQLKKKF